MTQQGKLGTQRGKRSQFIAGRRRVAGGHNMLCVIES